MFVANFLGGPNRGDHYKKPINVKADLIDFLLYKIFGSVSALRRINKKYNQDFNEDYFGGVIWAQKNFK